MKTKCCITLVCLPACSVATSEKHAVRIIHIIDWHYVDRDNFAADLRSQGDFTDAAIDHQHANLLKEVEALQIEQMAILRQMIKQHELKAVRIEGMTERDTDLIRARVNTLRRTTAKIDRYEKLAAESAKGGLDTATIETALAKLKEKHRHEMLRFGAAGRLVVAGELDTVLPLEDFAAYGATDPLKADGTVEIN